MESASFLISTNGLALSGLYLVSYTYRAEHCLIHISNPPRLLSESPFLPCRTYSELLALELFTYAKICT